MLPERSRTLSALLASTLAIGLVPAAGAVAQAEEDIAARVRAIPGMKLVQDEGTADGFRRLHLTYSQPADHRRPAMGRFEQRIHLRHKSNARPMVLYTTGYGLATKPTEPALLVDGNQLSVEQRFFTPSRPQPADWSRLNIWQAASDHHRLIQALKPLYPRKWISTGASKGGMTSVYHRRFFPADVDGTVAYVAPNDVRNPEDSAYDRFFAKVSTKACRRALEEVQHEALVRRARLVPRLERLAAERKLTFGRTIGSADRSFEMTVLDTAWGFWQYRTEADCPKVPASTASDDELWKFIDETAGFEFQTDQGLEPYLPYFYQAGTQLGWADPRFAHLRDVIRYPGLYQPRSVLPAELRAPYRAGAISEVDRWVREHGSQLLFVYGQHDPWGAEPFRLGRGSRDSFWFQQPGGNHGTKIRTLPEPAGKAARAALLRWAGVTDAPPMTRASVEPDTTRDRPVSVP